MKHAEQTIADLENRLKELQEESHKVKSAINCLCDVTGQPPIYDEIEEKPSKSVTIRSDEYYGRPLATVITEVLNKRKAVEQGAATLNEIYKELVLGGCKLRGKNDGIKKRGLAIAMSKNPKFHRLPNDTWGLIEWYPGIKEAKEDNGRAKGENSIVSEILSEYEKENTDTSNKE